MFGHWVLGPYALDTTSRATALDWPGLIPMKDGTDEDNCRHTGHEHPPKLQAMSSPLSKFVF